MSRLRSVIVSSAAALLVAAFAGCTDSADKQPTPTPPAQTDTSAGAGSAAAVPAPARWWDDDVFYEVFVRSYSDADGDGNGDLRGLIDKLGYLDDLGVTGLWLMPITESPSYHGYDTTDYFQVEADYGSTEDFKELVAQAHDRGIKVVMDLMLNHTSSSHPWFLDSANSASSKRDWYVWSSTNPGTTTDWGTPAWHARDGSYYLGLFWEGMPDLNYRNPAVTQQMYDVARFWLEEMGVDGFRLDAVRHLIEDGAEFSETPQTHAWLKAWDDQLDSVEPESLTVGEVWDQTSAVAPYVADDEVDVAFEFSLAEAILASVISGNPRFYTDRLRSVLAAYSPGQFAPFLSNHDQNRSMSQLGGGQSDPVKAKLAASILLTLPGVPFIYYGEEIGMLGEKPDELIRTPMQWDSSTNAGFTTGRPWAPPNNDYPTVNVAAEFDDPASLLNHYRSLLSIRHEHPALSLGSIDLLDTSCPAVQASLRRTEDNTDTILILVNFDPKAQSGCQVDAVSSTLPEGTYRTTDLLTGEAHSDVSASTDGAISGAVPVPSLAPQEAVILHLQG